MKAVGLIAGGMMNAAGLRAKEAAKKSGTWHEAYDSPKSARVPEEFQMALDKSAGWSFFPVSRWREPVRGTV